MFTVYFTTLNKASGARFDTEDEAVEYGKLAGFNFVVKRNNQTIGWWAPHRGYYNYGL